MSIVGALRAAGVEAGDEVVVPAFGNVEVAGAVRQLAARPVFADIDPSTYCLDPVAVESVLGSSTAAIVAVHRFGATKGVERLLVAARGHGLPVIEHRESRLPADEWTRRRRHASYLDARLRGVRPPAKDDNHVYVQYVIRVPGNGRPDRDAFARAIRLRGVDCVVPVRTPVHRLPEFRCPVALPETERAAEETLALSVHPSLTRRDMRRMVRACNALGSLLGTAV
ncbi:DegT/DnrJ/EryC1/StrS family aminotransferase [Streptomyces sp. WMMC905]|uniref:DegT/DnrJ/EryC1/StrS family aminotransferase n=1 Tax=Streptomyces sp. WMMC905 TaxID=3404123 RepID=UPI003B950B08